MTYAFEVTPSELPHRLDEFVEAIWDTLQSSFMQFPRGSAFLEYDRFAEAYEVLRRHTQAFRNWSNESVWAAFEENPLIFVVVRTMLGVSPPDWADLTSEAGIHVDQGQARAFDRTVRDQPPGLSDRSRTLIRAMLETAVPVLHDGVPDVLPGVIHRLDKVDTWNGLASIQHIADLGVPYPVLLYERFLGRPLASHRDAVSGIIGDVMESAVDNVLRQAGIVARRTGKAERIPGFEQAPDFIVPDEFNPHVVIEAKLGQDDGTIRDKVARILRLRQMADQRLASGRQSFQVIACIDGRGFGGRRQDMRDMIMATDGKVFTFGTLSRLVECSDLNRYRTR